MAKKISTDMILNVLIVVLVIVIGVLVYGTIKSRNNPNSGDIVRQTFIEGTPKNDEGKMALSDAEKTTIATKVFSSKGTASKVTEHELGGIKIGGNLSADLSREFSEGKYTFYATFNNLPNLKNGDTYEAWIVKREPTFEFISMGALVKEDDQYRAYYSSTTDLSKYDHFALTAEPKDGYPEPDETVLEGQFNLD